MAKGSEFERHVAKQLSLWWTGNQRDDVFWRATTSGARATQRTKQGKKTAGQYGDIAATDPIGAALVDRFAIELKRGYSTHTLHDLLDRGPMAPAARGLALHVLQAQRACSESGSLSWLLVTRRDRRQAMAWHPLWVHRALLGQGAYADGLPVPFVQTRLPLGPSVPPVDLVGLLLEAWLHGVQPSHIIGLV